MLSYGAILFPQAGQREPGNTTDLPVGKRWMSTLTKLPSMRPNRNGKTGASHVDWMVSIRLNEPAPKRDYFKFRRPKTTEAMIRSKTM